MASVELKDLKLSLTLLLVDPEDSVRHGTNASKSKVMSCVWQDLPRELVDRVLMFLPSSSQARFRSVCRLWKQVLTSAVFLEQTWWVAYARLRGDALCVKRTIDSIPQGVAMKIFIGLPEFFMPNYKRRTIEFCAGIAPPCPSYGPGGVKKAPCVHLPTYRQTQAFSHGGLAGVAVRDFYGTGSWGRYTELRCWVVSLADPSQRWLEVPALRWAGTASRTAWRMWMVGSRGSAMSVVPVRVRCADAVDFSLFTVISFYFKESDADFQPAQQTCSFKYSSSAGAQWKAVDIAEGRGIPRAQEWVLSARGYVLMDGSLGTPDSMRLISINVHGENVTRTSLPAAPEPEFELLCHPDLDAVLGMGSSERRSRIMMAHPDAIRLYKLDDSQGIGQTEWRCVKKMTFEARDGWQWGKVRDWFFRRSKALVVHRRTLLFFIQATTDAAGYAQHAGAYHVPSETFKWLAQPVSALNDSAPVYKYVGSHTV